MVKLLDRNLTLAESNWNQILSQIIIIIFLNRLFHTWHLYNIVDLGLVCEWPQICVRQTHFNLYLINKARSACDVMRRWNVGGTCSWFLTISWESCRDDVWSVSVTLSFVLSCVIVHSINDSQLFRMKNNLFVHSLTFEETQRLKINRPALFFGFFKCSFD